jgi:hypothetical protein
MSRLPRRHLADLGAGWCCADRCGPASHVVDYTGDIASQVRAIRPQGRRGGRGDSPGRQRAGARRPRRAGWSFRLNPRTGTRPVLQQGTRPTGDSTRTRSCPCRPTTSSTTLILESLGRPPGPLVARVQARGCVACRERLREGKHGQMGDHDRRVSPLADALVRSPRASWPVGQALPIRIDEPTNGGRKWDSSSTT